MRPQRIHRLRHNSVERSPRRVVFLDTETRWDEDADPQIHTLRLWVAKLAIRDGDPRHTVEESWAAGRTRGELLATLAGWVRTRGTTWIFCHNLAVELCTTRVVTELLEGGWTLNAHALTSDSPWARMSRGRHRIVLADSATWLPQSIDRLGGMVKLAKPELPDQAESDAVWLERCRADVDILAGAMERLLDWWDRQKLGCWSVTGTATAWNSYLHFPEPLRPVIDPDRDARLFERGALYAGMRYCFRVGPLPRRRYVLLDFERAHLTAAREFNLPRHRSRRFESLALNDPRLESEGWAPIAEVTLATRTPRYPLRCEGRVWHPQGSFRTVLCGPEIVEARARGELLAVHGGYLYRLGPIMHRWADWLTRLLDGELADSPEVARVFGKMASHRVFGKWAGRTSREVEPMPSEERTWKLERGVHHPSEARCSTLHLNGVAHILVHDQDADDAFPAVLAWIQSQVRCALVQLIGHLDPATLVSCNTDGVLVEADTDPDIPYLTRVCEPFVPRIKMVYADVDIISAAHMILDGTPHLSGVPARAEPTGPNTLAWTTWPRMALQLARARPDGYVRERREVDLARVPVPHWVLDDGTTRPVTATVLPNGQTALLGLIPEVLETGFYGLRDAQHPILTQLLAGGFEQTLGGIGYVVAG